jgi:alcohol dehydrogenase (NADP+)
LKPWGVEQGQRVGIVGLGGLGHLACKIAKAMGAEVFAFTHSKDKAKNTSGLDATIVLENDKDAFKQLKSSFDFILSTIPEKHDVNPYVELLKRDCTLCVVGALEPLEPLNNMEVAFHRKQVAGSLIGNLADTQEVLDFCAKHAIGPDVEVIHIEDINDAYDKVEKGDVRFRYVIDMATLAST